MNYTRNERALLRKAFNRIAAAIAEGGEEGTGIRLVPAAASPAPTAPAPQDLVPAANPTARAGAFFAAAAWSGATTRAVAEAPAIDDWPEPAPARADDTGEAHPAAAHPSGTRAAASFFAAAAWTGARPDGHASEAAPAAAPAVATSVRPASIGARTDAFFTAAPWTGARTDETATPSPALPASLPVTAPARPLPARSTASVLTAAPWTGARSGRDATAGVDLGSAEAFLEASNADAGLSGEVFAELATRSAVAASRRDRTS